MNVGSPFPGVGLLDYGLHLAGFEHRWFAEIDPFRRSILERRWPGVPVLGDVREVGAGSVERVDVVAGGFPCKGASTAGLRTGLDHPETALWREQLRVIRELRPRYAIVENVANILALHDGAVWGTVLGDLAEIGYDVWWDCLPAAAFGAPHLRDRVFAIAADATSVGERAAYSEANALAGERKSRPLLGERSAQSAHDANGGSVESRRLRRRTGGGDQAAVAHASRDGIWPQPEPERGRGGQGVVGPDGAAPADSEGERREGARLAGVGPLGGVEARRGFPWGDYEPAIRRWERALGRSAPFPLVRRVDDGRARRVERSRLSALGDGVLVQAGYLVGSLLMEHITAEVAA